ncbi:MBL fold metallo-hydrolase [Aeromicrobium phragmitis]|uniref:MBL fold metallo-hydrolase n=1 Tax=Aeromicrobium phragmitis TaxID=2478914 RepID=A0A3L8PNA1_9ACTN|nr:MBL fold metallo-hydrolase [Aeromicrobium phragmitis]RLV56269.1 MBL fold metallo-hydrolase [Aeromicrobium phragmitis]
MITRDVADGVHLVSYAHVNCYVIEDADDLTLVDAGLPRMWPMVLELIRRLGRHPDDIRALLLTHGHFDHVGFAAMLYREHAVPVWVHRDDARLAAHPYRYRPQSNRFLYPLRHPRSLPVLGQMAAAGALTVKGIAVTRAITTESALDVPGRPVASHTPGHTDGHCILHLPERDTVISGDALVTMDPYTGKTGPQIVASAATKDTRQAIASLDALAATEASVVLTGHGAPWTRGAAAAVDQARVVGEH